MSLYSSRGVSAQKEEVHHATRDLDKGLYPNAFCKIFKDVLGGDADWVNVMHADGAGTKSILAYLYWKETGDVSVWKGIAQDAIVMNLDDLLCVGIYDNLLFSSTIDRNKSLIPAEVLEAIVSGSRDFIDSMKSFGVNIYYTGGETADVGDVVRTITVNGTMTTRWPVAGLVTNEKIKAGNLIVGLAGFGKATYESSYNSGIASNGLTSARHDVLNKSYSESYPESFNPGLDGKVVYPGPHRLTDRIDDQGRERMIGDLLLSPTRTFAPVVKDLLQQYFDSIYGLVHCSGGGQTKCLKYVPDNLRIIKDNLFDPPIIFDLIQQSSAADAREMYQVFNMGTRFEIYTDEKNAENMIRVSEGFGVDARIIGRVEKAVKKELVITVEDGLISF